jgi:hypothetical protein
MAIKPIKLIKPPGYPAVGQALGRARACLGSEDHWSHFRVLRVVSADDSAHDVLVVFHGISFK